MEIDTRAKFQQQILGVQLTLTSAIVALGLSRPGLIGALLIVPFSSYLLCGRYVGQRTAMRWITRYIDEQIAPRVPGGLGWGRWSRANRRPARLLDWFLPLSICFPGAGLLALGWTAPLMSAPEHWYAATGVVVVWLVGLLATGTSLHLLAAVLRSPPPTPAPQAVQPAPPAQSAPAPSTPADLP